MFGFIAFTPYFVCFSIIPLWATADKLLSTIIGKLLTVWRGILQNFSKLPSLYMDIYNPFCGGVQKNFYCPNTVIGDFHGKTSYFSQKKNAPHLYWKFDNRFYNVFKKKVV